MYGGLDDEYERAFYPVLHKLEANYLLAIIIESVDGWCREGLLVPADQFEQLRCPVCRENVCCVICNEHRWPT